MGTVRGIVRFEDAAPTDWLTDMGAEQPPAIANE